MVDDMIVTAEIGWTITKISGRNIPSAQHVVVSPDAIAE
jgi:hypothetical protein